jgi:predicted DNA-binding ribbon-helix-helix protein
MGTDFANTRVVKHSLVIAGHRTSVSVEDAFWRRLRRIAAERGLSVNALAALIDASRGDANLSSAIRVFVLEAQSGSKSEQESAAGEFAVRADQ